MIIQGERINDEMRDNEMKDNRLIIQKYRSFLSSSFFHIQHIMIIQTEELRTHKTMSVTKAPVLPEDPMGPKRW